MKNLDKNNAKKMPLRIAVVSAIVHNAFAMCSAVPVYAADEAATLKQTAEAGTASSIVCNNANISTAKTSEKSLSTASTVSDKISDDENKANTISDKNSAHEKKANASAKNSDLEKNANVSAKSSDLEKKAIAPSMQLASAEKPSLQSDKLQQKKTQIEKIISNLEGVLPEIKVEWRRQLWQSLRTYGHTVDQCVDALKKKEQTLGRSNPIFVKATAQTAELYYMDGRYNDAAALLQWAIAAAGKFPTFNRSVLATMQCDLAQVYIDQKKFAEAKKLLEQAIPALPEDNIKASADQDLRELAKLCTRTYMVNKFIEQIPKDELHMDGEMSPIKIASRMSNLPAIATTSKAAAYFALARVYRSQGKLELLSVAYDKSAGWGHITVFDSFKAMAQSRTTQNARISQQR